MKIFTKKTLPELPDLEHYIIFAELKTGIILTLEGKRNINPIDFPILIFDSFNKAKEFAEKKVLENPEIECAVYNYKNEHIKTFQISI